VSPLYTSRRPHRSYTLNAEPLGAIEESRSRKASRGRGADVLKTPRQDVCSTQRRGPARGV
jgi:hypothetical protein